MLTRNRPAWLAKAIRYYQQQTYPYRELLIVADGDSVRGRIPESDTIRLIEIGGRLTIGEKRNFGCERARGSVIAHFDDDDESSPDRLEEQIARMEASSKAVVGYSSMYFTDGAFWHEYFRREHTFALGTSLCYRKDWWESHRFKPYQVGEDNAFVEDAKRFGQLDAIHAKGLMIASIHNDNTSPRRVNSNQQWRRIERPDAACTLFE